MAETSPPAAVPVGLLSLEEVRRAARRPLYRVLVATSAVVYVLVAMYVGEMVGFAPSGNTGTDVIIVNQGSQWWNYPGLLAIFPGGYIALPFFSTLVMILVGIGVGLGMGAAVFLSVQLFRRRGEGPSSTAIGGGAAGLTPALLSLVTLGACCSTTAAATAGLTWTAAASGTTLEGLLYYNWYPGVFQLTVLYIALVAQEQLLRTYRDLIGARALGSSDPAQPTTWRSSLHGSAAWATRLMLLIGGATWLLALPAEWTQTPAPALGGPWVAQAILQHLVPGGLAIAVAFAPRSTAAALAGPIRLNVPGIARGLILIGGVSLLIWWPAALASAGFAGLANEVLGAAGATGGWAGVLPPFGGLALAFRWGIQFLLLGAFAVAFAIVPEGVAAGLQRIPAPPRSTEPQPSELSDVPGSSDRSPGVLFAAEARPSPSDVRPAAPGVPSAGAGDGP